MSATFQESSATVRVSAVPMAHLSLELGHLYMEDFAAGPDRLREMFGQVAPWTAVARETCAAGVRPKTARISTCFLVDDYFDPMARPPHEVVPAIVAAAAAAGLTIDYLAREAACARADDVALAELVVGRLVPDPPPGTNGTRPPVQETGWLCNGTRSPASVSEEAMMPPALWRPPSEHAAKRHSVFIDVELWAEQGAQRQWSCPFLAAVWQLLRLGVLRSVGEAVAVPRRLSGPWPDTWAELAPITQLNPGAAPFSAYRTFSVLAGRFLPIEHAVRTILSQYAVEQAANQQVLSRGADEHLTISAELVERIEYAFAGTPWT